MKINTKKPKEKETHKEILAIKGPETKIRKRVRVYERDQSEWCE